MLVVGIFSLVASIYIARFLFTQAGQNPLEVVEISSLVAWLSTTSILLSYTWGKTDKPSA